MVGIVNQFNIAENKMNFFLKKKNNTTIEKIKEVNSTYLVNNLLSKKEVDFLGVLAGILGNSLPR